VEEQQQMYEDIPQKHDQGGMSQNRWHATRARLRRPDGPTRNVVHGDAAQRLQEHEGVGRSYGPNPLVAPSNVHASDAT
jgi:hypothetical protein